MTPTLKALSALLAYPGADLQAAAPVIARLFEKEGLVGSATLERLVELCEWIRSQDLVDLQEAYVALFDCARSLSLHIFEHIHGESRDRGQAMVDLAALYRRHGLVVAARELPDYLPLFLEFLSTRPHAEAVELLGEIDAVIAALHRRLDGHESRYAAVFAALGEIAGMPQTEPADDALVTDDEPRTDRRTRYARMDAAWREAEVLFGPEPAAGGACSTVEAMLRDLRAEAGRNPAAKKMDG